MIVIIRIFKNLILMIFNYNKFIYEVFFRIKKILFEIVQYFQKNFLNKLINNKKLIR